MLPLSKTVSDLVRCDWLNRLLAGNGLSLAQLLRRLGGFSNQLIYQTCKAIALFFQELKMAQRIIVSASY